MRALILRRVGLLETGAGGPVIVGRADNGDVLRLAGFPAPQRPSASTARSRDRCGSEGADRALPRRRRPIADRAVPERTAAAQSERDRARPLHRAGGADRSGPRLRRRDRRRRAGRPRRRGLCRRRKGSRSLVLDCRAFGGQAGASARIENYLGFPTGISGMALMARAYNQAQKFGVEMAIPDEVDRPAMPRDRDERPLRPDAVQRRTRRARARS